MAVPIRPDLELRCRVAADLAGLTYGGWVELVLRQATDEHLGLPGGAEALLAAVERREAGETMVSAAQGLGVKTRPAGAPVRVATVAELLAAGHTDEEIAERLHVTRQTVERARRKAGALLRGPAACPVGDDTLRRLHARGLSTAEIARRTGLKFGSTRTRLSHLGLVDNDQR